MESSGCCQCPSCHPSESSTSSCIFHNIRRCLVCDAEYQLNWNEAQSTHLFSCPNLCVKEFPSKRLAAINSANVNVALPPWNRTLLHSAVQTCDVDLIWELLQKGANPFAQDYRNITPIDIAQALYRNLTATKWLTEATVTTGLRTKSGGNLRRLYCERLQKILLIFPDHTPPQTQAFIAPMAAKRVFSEGTNHPSGAERGVQSFPLPPDVVRSVTSPGRSHTLTFDSKTSLVDAKPDPALDPPISHPPAQGPHLEDGTQLYTPLTLIRLTSEADGVAVSAPLFPNGDDEEVDMEGLFDGVDDLLLPVVDLSLTESPSNAVDADAPAGEGLLKCGEPLDWKIRELKLAVVSETEVEEKIAFLEGVYVCTACMEEITATSLGFSCPVLGCHGTLCLDCFVRSAHSIIASAMYAVPVIRCPGGCMHRIPTKVWKGVLMTQSATTPILEMTTDTNLTDAGSIIYEKYLHNAIALMKLRCGNCHGTCGLFYGTANEEGCVNFEIPLTPEDRLRMLEEILQPLRERDQILFLRTWLLFNKGKLSTETLTTVFCDLFEQFLTEDEREACQTDGIFIQLEGFIRPALLLFCDLERRLCAQLGFYRKFPKIITTCCYENHCFMCKVYGHHEGSTCQEIQENEIGIDAQVCPRLSIFF
jgi:hypothetical protein